MVDEHAALSTEQRGHAIGHAPPVGVGHRVIGFDWAQDSRSIVQTILALGNSLSIDAIAEGVETPEELDELRALGMKFAQGYLFSTPLEAAQAERLLSH